LSLTICAMSCGKVMLRDWVFRMRECSFKKR
jgi:hypothetical protein